MKKNSVIAGLLAGTLAILSFSCGSLSELLNLQTPTAEAKSVSIAEMDLEGISFNLNYDIKNPYGVSLSVKDIEMDVDCNDSKVTTIKTKDGISLKALSTSKNTATFKVPYDSIINLAKSFSAAKKTLPFAIDGALTIDTSSVPALSALGSNSISLPLSTKFDVPVFKPNLSVGNFAVKLPTFNDLKDQLIKDGLGVTKAIQVATALISGNGLSLSLLDGINMDIDFTFDLNVANEGSANWNFDINDCSLNTASGSIADIGPVSSKTITSSGKVPMKATLNTIQAGAFIVQLVNKTGKNPTFTLKSGLTFPDTSYVKGIPLEYSCEVPLSDVNK